MLVKLQSMDKLPNISLGHDRFRSSYQAIYGQANLVTSCQINLAITLYLPSHLDASQLIYLESAHTLRVPSFKQGSKQAASIRYAISAYSKAHFCPLTPQGCWWSTQGLWPLRLRKLNIPNLFSGATVRTIFKPRRDILLLSTLGKTRRRMKTSLFCPYPPRATQPRTKLHWLPTLIMT